MSSQALIIAYAWEGIDFTPKWEDQETGQVQWGNKHYRIFIWGHDQYNDPVCWIVEDYKPYCYVRIEDEIENEDECAPNILNALHENIKAYIKEKSSEPSKGYLKGLVRCNNIIQGYEPLEKRPFFYWNKEKHKIYKLYFHLETTMELCYEYLSHRKIHLPNGDKISAKAYNNGVSDRIPTEEKMMVDQKLQRCFWMYSQAQLVKHDGITSLEKEYIVSWRAIQMLPKEYSGKLGFPKPCTISFDSETWSEVYTRFPKPTRLRDLMYATGFRYRKYASLTDKNPQIINYLFIVWDNEKLGEFKDYSKKYGGTVIYIYCKSEKDMYLEMFAKIIELDPSWVITYNGLGYDWDYLEQRCSILDIKIPNLSRIRGWYKSQFTRKTWKRFSSAWPQYPGRIDVDMLYIIRLTIKFNSYKLKHVARALLPATEQKVELSYKEQFRIYGAKELKGMNKIMNYLLGDIMVPEKLYDKLSMPIYLHTNASVMHCNPMSLYTDGQSIRCVNQLHEETQENGMYINSREIPKSGKYIGGLVFDPDPGLYDNVLTFDWNSLYPSKMNVDNICFTTLIDEKKEALKPEEERTRDDECHIVDGDVPIVDKKTKEVIAVEHHRFRYIKNTTFKGLLPKIVTKLNALRKEYKEEMAACGKKADEFKALKDSLDKQIKELLAKIGTDETDNEEMVKLKKARLDAAEQEEFWLTEKEIWNVKQNAVKTSANSMYGFMGMKTGKFSFIEGGMSTTIGGRDALKETLRIVIEDFGAKLVYGDTDSVMVQFPESYINRTNYKTKTIEIAKYISSKFPEGMNIAPENFFLRYLVASKKRYGGVKVNPKNPMVDPTEKELLDPKLQLFYVKGFISVRGNSCGIVYENFNPFLIKLMLRQPIETIFQSIHDMVTRVMRREYPLEDYIFRQKLGTDYKSASNEMAVFTDRLKQSGRNHKPGEELEYVIVKTFADCLKGHKMQAPDLFDENNNVLDTLHYVTHNLAKPIEQLLCCVYDDEVLKKYEKKIIRPRKPTKSQKVTPVWHLNLYIQRYAAAIHYNWAQVVNHIKCIACVAEHRNLLNYWIDGSQLPQKMKERYGIDWFPKQDVARSYAVLKIDPIHRHSIWITGISSQVEYSTIQLSNQEVIAVKPI